MQVRSSSRTTFDGTRRVLSVIGGDFFRWVGIGLLLTAGLLIYAAFAEEWGVVPIAVALLVLLIYVAFAWLWATYLRYDAGQMHPAAWVGRLSRINARDQILVVDLGERELAIRLMRYLTTGLCTVVDIYNPQVFQRPVLRKWRQQMPASIGDNRIVWRTGMFDLLPVRDGSQDIIVLPHIVGELQQLGDQERLLNEAYRVLKPGGILVMIEAAATATSWLLIPTQAARYNSPKYWKKRIEKTRFGRVKQYVANDILVYISAQKVESQRGVQLSLLKESQFNN